MSDLGGERGGGGEVSKMVAALGTKLSSHKLLPERTSRASTSDGTEHFQ